MYQRKKKQLDLAVNNVLQ